MAGELTTDAKNVLRILNTRKNVLVSGPPGTGKSKLLNEIANQFSSELDPRPVARPVHVPGAAVPIPEHVPQEAARELQNLFRGFTKANRKVFRTVFHQNTKHREFISGFIPTLGGANFTFKVTKGILLRAAEFALQDNSASLLVIDEINRGPALQIFGGAIVAIEADKRLLENKKKGIETQTFEIIDPQTGEMIDFSLPADLYLIAAMNQADTSVEPLDVAFLRRWAPYKLEPNTEALLTYFRLPSKPSNLPAAPASAADVYGAAILAWLAINSRISSGRGEEYQLGHGVFWVNEINPPDTLEGALEFVYDAWNLLEAHIIEVFFGDVYGQATVLNAEGNHEAHLFSLKESSFANEFHYVLEKTKITKENIYPLLLAVIG